MVDSLALVQHLTAVLDEGKRTATYKLATLLALVDCATAHVNLHGAAETEIPTREVARRVAELYWPQVRPYPADDVTRLLLRQTTQSRAVTVDEVAKLRSAAKTVGATTFGTAELRIPDQVSAALDVIELNLVQMPLGKLQRPAGWTEHSAVRYPRFLYEDEAFTRDVTSGRLKASPMTVRLKPGVADALVALSGVLRPLLELYWTRDVARYNNRELGEDRLREFLFGATRIPLGPVVPGLRELQQDTCFYCLARLDTAPEVDHFLPWSRIPNDALANLVLAHRRCNNSKRDSLAGLGHLKRWATRPDVVLGEMARELGWAVERSKSLLLARGVYGHERPGSVLWLAPGLVEALDPNRLAAVMPVLRPTA